MGNKIEANYKIKVFVSSRCGDEKYDHVRSELKKLIEETGFAKVYLFEDGTASTQASEANYLYALDDSDVCIFLIDNADGITSNVMKEIQRAKSHPKKSLYLFNKENQEEPTQIQKELTGRRGEQYYEAETFNEFISKGYESLLNDICDIYSNYCKNRLVDLEFGEHKNYMDTAEFAASVSIEKRVVTGIDKTKNYISHQIFNGLSRKIVETTEFDNYCEEFLHVLFGEKNIREFNTSLFLSLLEGQQSETLHAVTEERWKAIQYYYTDNLSKCVEHIKKALHVAKEKSLPNWIIQDILIDLRNITIQQGQANNKKIINCEAQQELSSDAYALFYPLIDRYDKLLFEEIAKQNIKTSIKSPYSFVWGSNINTYADYLSNAFVVSAYHGSLTQMLLAIDKLKIIAFYLCRDYSDWQFRVLMLKISISKGNKNEIKGYINLFNDILGKMNDSDSLEIYKFCTSIPNKYQQDIAKFEAIKYLGYYFSNDDYENISKELIELIENWFDDSDCPVELGDHIFETLKDNCHRLNKTVLIKICLDTFRKKIYRFYDSALDLIAFIGLEDVDKGLATTVIEEINCIIIDTDLRNKCYKLKKAIIRVRKSDRLLTSKLDQNVLAYMPEFYKGTYALEIDVESQEDSEKHIKKYISVIKDRNRTQGVKGKYVGYSDNPYKIIKNIVKLNNVQLHEELIYDILDSTLETLTCVNQLASDKVEAIKLIIFIKFNAEEKYINFNDYFEKINKEIKITTGAYDELFSKQTEATIQFNLMMLYLAFEELEYSTFLEYLGNYGESDEFDKIEALKTLINLLESNATNKMNKKYLFMVLQFVIGMTQDLNHDVRFYSIKALLLLINDDTKDVILKQLSKTMDYDSVYIKNMIIDHFDKLMNIDPVITNYMIQKASVDNHYIIRKRIKEYAEKKEND